MSKSRPFFSILVPSATVFISSACIMVLELVASRLIARHLGSSLYTWTAVIGVVLAGITIGNYIGGRIADRFQTRKTLATLFAISSVACVITVILNNLVGEWIWLWHFSWPVRIFTHVSLVFLLPSVLLGTISPVVAKMALDRGLAMGRTVGTIYAWGAAGSIAGTFAAGYYLIATMGTIAIIWTVAGILLLMAILYWVRLWPLHLWTLLFVCALILSVAKIEWCQTAGAVLALREKPDPKVIYQDESQYCYIAVRRISTSSDKRVFMQDKLMHSQIIMQDITDLQYSYEQIYAAVTRQLSQNKNKLSVLVIGGGGYVFPRYVEKIWPGSRVDVVEIDPGVTEAAMQAFGLERDTAINTFTMDARNYVTKLLEQERTEGKKTRYDFIYEDALSDYSIPYQLTTKEFNDKITHILTDNGIYMIELIDIYDSGLFVGSFINTLEQTFPYVYVVTEDESRSARNTFVVIAANREINLENIASEKSVKSLNLWILSDSDIKTLVDKAHGIVLTDDYAPVENLLAPVILKSAVGLLAEEYLAQAEELRIKEKWDASISRYRDVLKTDPSLSIKAYHEIGMILAGQNKLKEAVGAFNSTLEYNDKAEVKRSMSNIHYNVGVALKRLGNKEEAARHLHKAVEGYREDLAGNPDSAKIAGRLGNVLAEVGNFSEATEYFQQAVNMNPYDMKNHLTLAQALMVQERYDEAIEALKKAVRFMLNIGDKTAADKLQSFLERVQVRKLEQQK